ncbi:MAG: hypothetical protein FJ138_09960, partial [Deltaproteobacteria bacterium]|nr:hypothetical protein [Deltaproteobacteria bacterium]
SDRDDDGVLDDDDNCPDSYNPEQRDLDGDGDGDVCEPDGDGDGVPDSWDPAAADPAWPGRALPNTVYAHTASELYKLDVKTERLERVAPLSVTLTDIAIDRAGVLWGISYNELFICHPFTGECRAQGPLPNVAYNGLTFLPAEELGSPRDALVAIAEFGAWTRLDLDPATGEVETTQIGRYLGERSSGDAFSIAGVGTFASIKRFGEDGDLIARIDPARVGLFEDLVVLSGLNAVYGLAGWRGALLAFDESGRVLRVDLQTGAAQEINTQPIAWWGAAVSTVLLER